MPTYLRNRYEFLITSSIVIPFIAIMVLGRRNPNSIDLSLTAALCLLWPLLGILALRGYLQHGKALILIVYLIIFIAYVIKYFLSINIVFSIVINTIASIFMVTLPFVISKSAIEKKYLIFSILLIFWFTIITYLYPMLPRWFSLEAFLVSFFLTLIPIRKVLKSTDL